MIRPQKSPGFQSYGPRIQRYDLKIGKTTQAQRIIMAHDKPPDAKVHSFAEAMKNPKSDPTLLAVDLVDFLTNNPNLTILNKSALKSALAEAGKIISRRILDLEQKVFPGKATRQEKAQLVKALNTAEQLKKPLPASKEEVEYASRMARSIRDPKSHGRGRKRIPLLAQFKRLIIQMEKIKATHRDAATIVGKIPQQEQALFRKYVAKKAPNWSIRVMRILDKKSPNYVT